jgi:hypothetical protein
MYVAWQIRFFHLPVVSDPEIVRYSGFSIVKWFQIVVGLAIAHCHKAGLRGPAVSNISAWRWRGSFRRQPAGA